LNVQFTAQAERQLIESLAYIAVDRPGAASAVLERIEAALERIAAFPEAGRPVPEFPGSPYREVIVRPYRLFYRRSGIGLVVVAVWHEAQLPKPGSGGPEQGGVSG